MACFSTPLLVRPELRLLWSIADAPEEPSTCWELEALTVPAGDGNGDEYLTVYV